MRCHHPSSISGLVTRWLNVEFFVQVRSAAGFRYFDKVKPQTNVLYQEVRHSCLRAEGSIRGSFMPSNKHDFILRRAKSIM